jgi:hypothetical protein
MFAYVEHGALVQFLPALPFTFKGVRGVPTLPAAERVALGLLPVADLTPAFDPAARQLANVAPTVTVLSDRVEITRQTEPIPAQEIAERTRRQALQEDPRAVELRDKLRTATPAEISAYVDARVTDLPSARTMLKQILIDRALQSG